jgi:hypothetical protein
MCLSCYFVAGYSREFQIVFDRRFENDGPTPYRARMTVDGTDFEIRQPTLKSEIIKKLTRDDRIRYKKSWYSHKFKGPGLRYEVGVCIKTGVICWVNGPFKPGLYNDLMIFRNKLIHCLIRGEMVEADAGYRGEPIFVSVPNVDDTEEQEKFKSNARARQENVNKFFKEWEILAQVFRHNVNKHCIVFWAIVTLTQITFDMEEKLNYQVEYVGETYEEARQYLGNYL